MILFYCPACDHVTADAGQALAHLEAQHAALLTWLAGRLGAAPLPLGAAVWYWNQDQDPAREGWQRIAQVVERHGTSIASALADVVRIADQHSAREQIMREESAA